jgi:mitochondrial intermembrane space import and assembly protein 40
MEKDIIIFQQENSASSAAHDASNTSSANTDSTKATDTNSSPNDQMEAFNEETNEINWDCPCIADLIKPPCGENFKEAFSCFVYSKEEVRGSDCIPQFQAMQKCFQQHPDIYGVDEDEEEGDEQDKEKK